MNDCDINYRQSGNKRLLVELTLIEISQITQPDDDGAGAGRSPKRLKSLFKRLMSAQLIEAMQVAKAEPPVNRRTAVSSHDGKIHAQQTPQTENSNVNVAPGNNANGGSATPSPTMPRGLKLGKSARHSTTSGAGVKSRNKLSRRQQTTTILATGRSSPTSSY